MRDGSGRLLAAACIAAAVFILAFLAVYPATRRILPLQLREAVLGIATARMDVSNANPEDLYSDVWDVDSLARIQPLEPLDRTLKDHRTDWRVQIAIAADERAHGPYDDLKLLRIKACYERAMELAPSRILARSDLALWLCGTQLPYVRPEIASDGAKVAPRPLEARPEFIALAKQRLAELR